MFPWITTAGITDTIVSMSILSLSWYAATRTLTPPMGPYWIGVWAAELVRAISNLAGLPLGVRLGAIVAALCMAAVASTVGLGKETPRKVSILSALGIGVLAILLLALKGTATSVALTLCRSASAILLLCWRFSRDERWVGGGWAPVLASGSLFAWAIMGLGGSLLGQPGWYQALSAQVEIPLRGIIALSMALAISSGHSGHLRKGMILGDADGHLQDQAEEKEYLIQELHHRVKNNLQIISSLLALQESKMESRGDKAILEELADRVTSIAMVHEMVYQKENLEWVDMRIFFDRLLRELAFSSYAANQAEASVTGDALSLNLDKAVPCAIAVTELVANAHKHAFIGRTSGSLIIELKVNDGRAQVEVQDDGPGFCIDDLPRKRRSPGILIVDSLALQLNGEAQWVRVAGRQVARISFPLPQPKERAKSRPSMDRT